MVLSTANRDQNKSEAHFVESLNQKYDEMFRYGDDIPFVFLDKFKLNPNEDKWAGFYEGEKYRSFDGKTKNEKQIVAHDDKQYYQYMLGLWEESESAKKSAGKIAYAVISALNEQWKRSECQNLRSKSAEGVEIEITFRSRLYYHLMRKDMSSN